MLRPSLRPGRIACLALALAALLAASEARAVTFDLFLDPAFSQLDPANGPPAPLSGTGQVDLGSLPPLGANTTFDLVALAVVGGGLSITLDPDLTTPGLGVLRPDGSFLIPNLFLRLDDGQMAFDQTIVDVQGTFVPCGGAACLETSFQVDSLGPAGLIDVSVVAIGEVPEPSPWLLLPLAGAAALRRHRAEIAR
jgi:hypothetical protein